jgi:hypothetical protein
VRSVGAGQGQSRQAAVDRLTLEAREDYGWLGCAMSWPQTFVQACTVRRRYAGWRYRSLMAASARWASLPCATGCASKPPESYWSIFRAGPAPSTAVASISGSQKELALVARATWPRRPTSITVVARRTHLAASTTRSHMSGCHRTRAVARPNCGPALKRFIWCWPYARPALSCRSASR